jgi:hypothetical protein
MSAPARECAFVPQNGVVLYTVADRPPFLECARFSVIQIACEIFHN